ncbi:MAG: O-antigen ligase family protein [Patescibacteria group bacterium]
MSTLEKTLRGVVLAGIFALPFVCLLVTTSLFFPYITGKNFAFRIIVEVVTAAWLALALVNPAYRPRRSWVLAALSIFVVLIAISDAQGVNAFKSFWSNFERMDGWITIAHLLLYTVVAASVLQTERLWRWLFWTSLGVSVYLSVVGLLQVAGFVAIGQGTASGLAARVDATFGNPIYLAVYMLFHVFLAAMLLVQSWASRSPGDRLVPSISYGAIIALDTLTLLLTGTRGTMLGLIGGAVLAILIYALVRGSGRIRIRIVAVASVCLVVVLGGALKLGKDTSFVKSVGFLDRLASISLSDTTIASRFTNMSIAWQGVKERPIFGWGQENYAIVFDKYYNPRMYANEQWFDRVHDIIFDWWVAGGTLGLLAYLSIFAAALWALWRSRSFTAAEQSILTGLLAGYFAHNLTVFDNVTSYILFGMLLAYIVFRSTSASPQRDGSAGALESAVIPAGRLLPRQLLPYVTLAAALAVWGVAWFVNQPALAQNRALISAITPHNDITRNLQDFKDAITYQSIGTQEAREQLSQITAQMAQSNVPADMKQKFFDLTVSEMKAQEAASPLDARFPLFLGTVYGAYGALKEAQASLLKAHELSPDKQTIYYALGQNAWAQGNNAQALTYFKTAYELETSNNEAHIYYVVAAIRAGEDALATREIQSLSASGGIAADQRILAAYAARGQIAKAIPLWEARIKAAPDDAQAYFTLAAIYYQNGQITQAIEALQRAKQAIPSLATQADPLIEQIRNGTVKLGQ